MAYLELAPGDPRSVGGYRLLGRLEAGGTGQVYLAVSSAGGLVALKVISADLAAAPGFRSLFTDGVVAARGVEGSFTAAVVDADPGAERPWVATAYIAGPSLRQLVDRFGPLPDMLLLALSAGLAEGVREIQVAGFVHRDLTPSNVILGSDGPKIVDFGIAVAADAVAPPGQRAIVGTPGFMSPEQSGGGTVGPPTDVFSIGALVAYAATGRGPFEPRPGTASVYQIVNAEPEATQVSAAIWQILTRCLARDPSQRPTATELAGAIYRLAAAEFGLDDVALRAAMGILSAWSGPGDQTLHPRTRSMSGTGGSLPMPADMAFPDLDARTDPGLVTGSPVPQQGGGPWTVTPPPPPPPDPPLIAHLGTPGPDQEPPARFLTGILPERAPADARLSLLVMVTLLRGADPSSALKDFAVLPDGAMLTVTVSAPGLIPLGDLEQELYVPFATDSEPIRFGFVAGPAGLHTAVIRAFATGTFLGELALQISVEPGAVLEEGRSRVAALSGLAAEPGEVTLQVSRTDEDRYSFQLIGEAWNPVEITKRLAGDPTQIVGALTDELRSMSANESRFSNPALVRNRIKNLGAQLWADVVPEAIRRQFWAQGDRIKLFTIASDMDTVPWELLYPVDGDNDNGFLVEQFPVVRRVYGQSRARVLRLDDGAAYVVPPGSPANAMAEVSGVSGIFPWAVRNRGVHASLTGVTELLDSVPSVLHFACHNTFNENGSVIMLDGGPLRPSDLAIAVQRRRFAGISPLVFLNACRTAGDIPGFMQMMGWARQFMGAGAGAFVGSLWAVRSSSARTFAEEFYRAMVNEAMPLGAASLHARRAISADPGDPTWLAYTIYGNPSASIG